MKRPTPMDRLMADHIEMPGFPQIIVTRHFAYQWLVACGWSQSETGCGSLDYAIFSKSAVSNELTDEETRDHFLAEVRPDYIRESNTNTLRQAADAYLGESPEEDKEK